MEANKHVSNLWDISFLIICPHWAEWVTEVIIFGKMHCTYIHINMQLGLLWESEQFLNFHTSLQRDVWPSWCINIQIFFFNLIYRWNWGREHRWLPLSPQAPDYLRITVPSWSCSTAALTVFTVKKAVLDKHHSEGYL